MCCIDRELTGKRLQSLLGGHGPVRFVDGYRVAVMSVAFRKLRSLERDVNLFVDQMDISEEEEDETYHVVSSHANLVNGSGPSCVVWSFDGKRLESVEGSAAFPNSTSLSSSGELVVMGLRDGSVRVQSLLEPKVEAMRLEGHRGYVYSVAFNEKADLVFTGKLLVSIHWFLFSLPISLSN